jgi:hypothetical protein
VTDACPAIVPGASITAKRVDTGVARATVSDADGRYRLLALTPGEYEVVAELSGFTAARRTGLRLSVGAEVAVD